MVKNMFVAALKSCAGIGVMIPGLYDSFSCYGYALEVEDNDDGCDGGGRKNCAGKVDDESGGERGLIGLFFPKVAVEVKMLSTTGWGCPCRASTPR